MLKAAFVRGTFNVQINPAVFFVALGFLAVFGGMTRLGSFKSQAPSFHPP